jgi:ligand-binding SRPBCC domain-containing protein
MYGLVVFLPPSTDRSVSADGESRATIRLTYMIFVTDRPSMPVPHDPTATPSWAAPWLRAAGVYNLLWGTAIIAFPHLLFDLCGIPRLNYPEIWQCVGMIVGVYGVGYWVAANDPRRHWPIVLVGFLGKLFGPVGFAVAVARGVFPPAFGLTILTNDLIWWVPFALILWDAFVYRRLHDRGGLTIQTFVKESRFPARPADVFHFHERGDALARLIPPGEPLRVLVAPTSLKPGTKVILRGSLFGLPLTWVAVHTEYDPPRQFADRQESGPFEYWHHRHHVLDDGAGGTILRDEVEYALPFGRCGRVLGGRLVRKKLNELFDYRHEATRQALCEPETTSRT